MARINRVFVTVLALLLAVQPPAWADVPGPADLVEAAYKAGNADRARALLADYLDLQFRNVSQRLSTGRIEDAWGSQQWYNDRGSAIVPMTGLFYSMSDVSQSYSLRMVVDSDGGKDNAANLFDGDEGSSSYERHVLYQLVIDGDGVVTVEDQTWE